MFSVNRSSVNHKGLHYYYLPNDYKLAEGALPFFIEYTPGLRIRIIFGDLNIGNVQAAHYYLPGLGDGIPVFITAAVGMIDGIDQIAAFGIDIYFTECRYVQEAEDRKSVV